MADRATLEAWIVETERKRERLHKLLPIAAIIAVGLTLLSRPIGLGAIMLVVLVGVFGSWIMSSHLLDWRTRIDELDKPKPVGRAVKRKD